MTTTDLRREPNDGKFFDIVAADHESDALITQHLQIAAANGRTTIPVAGDIFSVLLPFSRTV